MESKEDKGTTYLIYNPNLAMDIVAFAQDRWLSKNTGKTIRKENLESEIALVLEEAKQLGAIIEVGKIRPILGVSKLYHRRERRRRR